MNERESELYRRARTVGRRRRDYEAESIVVLQEADQIKLWEKVDLDSLYHFAVEVMEFDEAEAYKYINVARKALVFPDLQAAIQDRSLIVSKAVRIVGSMTSENAKSLITFAVSHTIQQINREVARINPKEGGKNYDKHLSPEFVEIARTIPIQLYEDMKRAEEVYGKTSVETMSRVYHIFLEKYDHLRKAKRALEKGKIVEPSSEILCLNRVSSLIKNIVFLKTDGQCTHVYGNGERCGNRRYVHIHHIIFRSQGGNHHPNNLTTLCAHHHHQLHRRAG